MSALAWPLVALVAIGAAFYLARRWQDRSADVEAARKMLADTTSGALAVALRAQTDAATATVLAKSKDAEVAELRNRVSAIELTVGLER